MQPSASSPPPLIRHNEPPASCIHPRQTPPGPLGRFLRWQRLHEVILLRCPGDRARNQCPASAVRLAHRRATSGLRSGSIHGERLSTSGKERIIGEDYSRRVARYLRQPRSPGRLRATRVSGAGPGIDGRLGRICPRVPPDLPFSEANSEPTIAGRADRSVPGWVVRESRGEELPVANAVLAANRVR